jgi:ADP-heptose:LPS heptosyltransferase
MKPITNFRPNKILVCQLRQIGDVVLTTPLIRLLKKNYPHAVIDVFTEKKCAPVLYNNPDISNIWELDKQKDAGIFHSLALYRHIGRQGYDLVIDCQQLPRCRFVTLFSQAKIKLTYLPPWYNRPFYTHWATPIDGYAAKYKASFLSPLGISWDGEPPRIYLSKDEKQWADDFLAAHGKAFRGECILTVDPTHRRATRCWPAEHYAQLLSLLAKKLPTLTTILLYGPGEKKIVENIARLANIGSQCIVPTQILSLREMAAIIEKANLHLGNCSAPAHFAAALDTPSLTIKGSTSKAWTNPAPEHSDISLGLPCQPCNKDVCPLGTIRCLKDLLPQTVLEYVLKKISAVHVNT